MIENLEIFIITYNRKYNLKQTLDSVYSDNSPIKDLTITILDNKSTDGTSELIDEYIKDRPNSKHIIHNRNIGGNANIARCYELASKEYFWILCDDDIISWDNWTEVVCMLEKKPDIVVVSNYLEPKKNIAQLIGQLSFVPAGIYRSANITDTVMQNIGYQISTMFPQLALVCKIINSSGKIEICGKPIVTMVLNDNSSYTRGMVNNEKHPLMSSVCWSLGFLKSIQMLHDVELRNYIIENLQLDNGLYILHPDCFIEVNVESFNNQYINEIEYFALLPEKFKLMFTYDYFREKNKNLALNSYNYENSELKYQRLKRSKALKIGNILLYIPRKIFRK